MAPIAYTLDVAFEERTTFVFSFWTCVVDGIGGFSHHLTDPVGPLPNSVTSSEFYVKDCFELGWQLAMSIIEIDNTSTFGKGSRPVHVKDRGNQAPSKKNIQEIPTPQFDIVDTYERDYTRTFAQPTSYIRGRGARAEIGEFVEYDLDNEDEDWLEDFNNERKNINPEKLEVLLFKLESLDHKARERAGAITPTFIGPVPVLLQLDTAMEALQYLSVRYAVFQAVYNYWKEKRERWQKPILRRLQPPPPVNDTNPYNVFRPREKAHRLHTRRMQRRENNIQSFEKLRLVRRNLEQARALMDALIKREETKREAMECQVNLQRIQMKYKHEAQLVDDGTTLSGFQQTSSRFESSDDDYADSDDTTTEQQYIRPAVFHPRFPANKLSVIPPLRIKRERELKRRPQQNGWVFRRKDIELDQMHRKIQNRVTGIQILRSQYSYSQDHLIPRSWSQQVSGHHQIHPLRMVPQHRHFGVEVGLDEVVASSLIDGTLFCGHQLARKPLVMCHTVTDLPHLKGEEIILLQLELMPLAQLVNCEVPEQFSIGTKLVLGYHLRSPESQLSSSMDLMERQESSWMSSSFSGS
ncbi:hypothetical protein BAE44_0023176 [Dichanthelium oligosanthes]|uniref:Enhancer of polycomb-like protein n=1 Tax=Dichanthelium oligosanthes TaxID=888268 RepID=A0A1E5USN0_9POAL|nr:hypothetical protein BAE44_0023176 [Dichanthelium oligosanthes]